MKQIYEINCHFENAWVVKSPWVESMVGANGQVHKVKCKIYNKIEGHNKFMELKLIICANMLTKE
jgi:hypothetical protein